MNNSTPEEIRKRDIVMVILIILSVVLVSIFGCTPSKQVVVDKKELRDTTVRHPRYESTKRIH